MSDEQRPLPEDLEHIGMGLECVECESETSWLPCWNCGGEGGWDGEYLMEEDPLWYDENDYRACDECKGKGGHPYCIVCRKIVEVKPEPDKYHVSQYMEPSESDLTPPPALPQSGSAIGEGSKDEGGG